jgi:hypothetical protein
MKIYSTAPEGNQMADLEPARYFNLALRQIKEAEEWLRTADDACQPLLVHVDVLVHLSKKYPEMAKERLEDLNRSAIRSTFDGWFERCGKKIPAKFRDGIRQSADELLAALDKI